MSARFWVAPRSLNRHVPLGKRRKIVIGLAAFLALSGVLVWGLLGVLVVSHASVRPPRGFMSGMFFGAIIVSVSGTIAYALWSAGQWEPSGPAVSEFVWLNLWLSIGLFEVCMVITLFIRLLFYLGRKLIHKIRSHWPDHTPHRHRTATRR